MQGEADLTEAERRYFERAREAEQRGLTLRQYYRTSGLSLDWLYNTRRRLLRKGLVTALRGPRASAAAKEAGFVEVRVAPAALAPRSEPSVVCRLRHPSGWAIECASWPEASWMRALTGEQP